MSSLYRTNRDTKTLEIEDTTREGFAFHTVITLRKLGVVTMLDYFLTGEEADQMAKVLSKTARTA